MRVALGWALGRRHDESKIWRNLVGSSHSQPSHSSPSFPFPQADPVSIKREVGAKKPDVEFGSRDLNDLRERAFSTKPARRLR